MEKFVQELVRHFDAGFPFLGMSVIGTEQERISRVTAKFLAERWAKGGDDEKEIVCWFDIANWPKIINLTDNTVINAATQSDNDPFSQSESPDPLAAVNCLRWISAQAIAVNRASVQTPPPSRPPRILLFMANCHYFAQPESQIAPLFVQSIRNAVAPLKSAGCTVVFIGPNIPSSPALLRVITEVEAALPDVSQLADIVNAIRKDAKLDPASPSESLACAAAAAGLTLLEAENIFAMLASEISDRKIPFDTDEIIRLTKSSVEQIQGLEMIIPQAHDTLDRISGLDALKSSVLDSLKSVRHPKARAKGIIEVGIPGVAKSDVVKKIAKTVGRKLFRWDVRASYGSLLGETEANARAVFRVVKAAAPCILMIDEAGAALSGGESSGRTDGGVTSGLIGYVQTELQEMAEDVFVVFTVNNLETIPAPMRRSGRMDKTWWFGFPPKETVVAMFRDVWCPFYGYTFDEQDLPPDLTDWVGADVEAAVREAVREGKKLRDVSISPTALLVQKDIKQYMRAAHGAVDATTGKVMLWDDKTKKLVPSDRMGVQLAEMPLRAVKRRKNGRGPECH